MYLYAKYAHIQTHAVAKNIIFLSKKVEIPEYSVYTRNVKRIEVTTYS